MEAVSIPRTSECFTRRDAAIIWARAFNTRDCSELAQWLDDDLRYVSEWAEGEIDSRDDYLEHPESKLRTIRNSTIVASAELAEMAPFPGSHGETQPCVMVELRGDPLATVLFEVNGTRITRIDFGLNPDPDAFVRQGIFPGVKPINPVPNGPLEA